MSILRQEFLTSAVMRIDAEMIRARLLNRKRKENSACVSNVTFTEANRLLKRGATAGSAGRDALGAGSITPGVFTLPAVPAGVLCGFFTPLNKLHVPVFKKTNLIYALVLRMRLIKNTDITHQILSRLSIS